MVPVDDPIVKMLRAAGTAYAFAVKVGGQGRPRGPPVYTVAYYFLEHLKRRVAGPANKRNLDLLVQKLADSPMPDAFRPVPFCRMEKAYKDTHVKLVLGLSSPAHLRAVRGAFPHLEHIAPLRPAPLAYLEDELEAFLDSLAE